MSEIDSKTVTKGEVAFKTLDIAADGTTMGEVIDTLGFESLTYHAQSGALNAGNFDFLLFESDTAGGVFSLVPDDNRIGSLVGFVKPVPVTVPVTPEQDDSMKRVGTIGKKQFQRIDVVAANTAAAGNFISIVGILGNPKSAPTAE